MPRNSEQYWTKRQEQKFRTAEKQIDKYYRELTKAFEKAKKDVHSAINNFYVKYAVNNELTYDVAMKELNFQELKDLKDDLEWFKTLSMESIGEFNLVLENMSMRARITRYQALEMQINAILENLYAIEYENYGKETLAEIYKDQYYRTIFNIEQFQGFHSEFAQVNTRAVEELIKYPFNGANYSDRLWRQKADMVQRLKGDIITMLVRGTHPRELADGFAKAFNTKQYEAYRLLHTEGAFIAEQATINGYKEDGIEHYKILATLDNRTSEICQEKDSKVYKVDEAIVGKNLPPFHMFCRTTTTPHFEDVDTWIDERIARNPETSKTYKVGADTTYPEWYEKYVRYKEDMPEYEARAQKLIDDYIKTPT